MIIPSPSSKLPSSTESSCHQATEFKNTIRPFIRDMHFQVLGRTSKQLRVQNGDDARDRWAWFDVFTWGAQAYRRTEGQKNKGGSADRPNRLNFSSQTNDWSSAGYGRSRRTWPGDGIESQASNLVSAFRFPIEKMRWYAGEEWEH